MRYLRFIPLAVLFTCMFTVSSTDVYAKKDKVEDYMDVDIQSILNFTVSKPSDFEQTQTIANAILISLLSKKDALSMYVKVSAYSTPSGANQNDIPLELDLYDYDSKKLTVGKNPMQLTKSDQLLFYQKKENSENEFHYKLNLMPLGYDYPEGQYNFTILFTMTQQ